MVVWSFRGTAQPPPLPTAKICQVVACTMLWSGVGLQLGLAAPRAVPVWQAIASVTLGWDAGMAAEILVVGLTWGGLWK